MQKIFSALKLKKNSVLLILIIILPLIGIFFSLFIGRYPLTWPDIMAVFRVAVNPQISQDFPDIYNTVVWKIRLPRAILGAMVGGSLAISGAAFQGLFRNPLVSSGILGVSSGASFGAVLAIILYGQNYMVYFYAFGFALLAVAMSFFIGQIYHSTPTITLVLGGVVVSSIFSALVSFAKFVADPFEKLPSITFWLMGSLATSQYKDILFSIIPISIGVIGLIALRWQINVLSMGDKEAQALGINNILTKIIMVLCASLATAGAISVSGNIGWVGLVMPHIGRMMVGNDNRILIPASFFLGAFFMIVVDNLSRTLIGAEIPLGILTALIGGPFFVYLLKKTKGKGW
ncbi:MAG: iron ABC transporter permease [Candidatus Caldatribacteriota bacterium]|jgi:iron complex transport system permease protein|nr:iron ABC transporter permease [Atribacterota bacterium]MDD4288561.1 iron ABC transporter permease [Atribacterota bacterium]